MAIRYSIDQAQGQMKRAGRLLFATAVLLSLPAPVAAAPTPPTNFHISSPWITNPVQDQTVLAGQNATFVVTATGDEPLIYRWTVNGLNVGSNSSSYTRTNCQVGDNGDFVSVTVSNATGIVRSGKATLKVNPSRINGSGMQSSMVSLLQSAQLGRTTNDWTFETSTGRVAHSWISGLDMSGYCLAGALGSANAFDCSLITPLHCIGAAHAWPNPGAIGMQLVFQGVDGRAYTNQIAAVSAMAGYDVVILTLASNMPSVVHPFEILPTNWWNYASVGVSNQYVWPALWINNATGNHADVTTIALCNGTYAGEINFEPDVPQQPAWVRSSPFFEAVPLIGNPKSSAGVFAVLATNHVAILTSIYYSDVSGPCYSAPNIYSWIEATVGSGVLKVSDLSQWMSPLP